MVKSPYCAFNQLTKKLLEKSEKVFLMRKKHFPWWFHHVQLTLHIFGKQLQFWVQKPFHYTLMTCLSYLNLPGSKKLVHFNDQTIQWKSIWWKIFLLYVMEIQNLSTNPESFLWLFAKIWKHLGKSPWGNLHKGCKKIMKY